MGIDRFDGRTTRTRSYTVDVHVLRFSLIFSRVFGVRSLQSSLCLRLETNRSRSSTTCPARMIHSASYRLTFFLIERVTTSTNTGLISYSIERR